MWSISPYPSGLPHLALGRSHDCSTPILLYCRYSLSTIWRRFKNAYVLLNLRGIKFPPVNKIHIFRCMGKIICVKFQRAPLKFHTKYLTHTLKDRILCNIELLWAPRFTSSYEFLNAYHISLINEYTLVSDRGSYKFISLIHKHSTFMIPAMWLTSEKVTQFLSISTASPPPLNSLRPSDAYMRRQTDRRQAIIWTNAGLLLIGPLRTYFNENLIKIQQFSMKKMHVKMSSAKWRPSFLGFNVLRVGSLK